MPFYITPAFAEESEYDLGVFAGPDPALLTEIDVPRLLEGRRPDPSDPHEVLVNRFTQRSLDVEVGDTVTVSTFTAEQFGEDVFDAPAGPTIPFEITGISVTAYDLADPEVECVLRHAGLPREVLGRGGWLRSHDRDRHRPRPRPSAGRGARHLRVRAP